jgi:hypothetical protein
MGYRCRFYIECLKHGWRGSIEEANTAGALPGGLFVLLFLQYSPVLKELGDIEAPPTIFGSIVFNLVISLVSLALAWSVIFLVRIFFVAPVHLYVDARREIDALTKPREGANPNLTIIAGNTTTINNPIINYHVHVAPGFIPVKRNDSY